MANIGSLAVTLSLDAVAFASGLDRADKGLKSFAATATATLSVATAGLSTLEAIGEAGFGWITQGIDDLAQLGRQARELGIDVNRLSGLEFAAGRSGEGMEVALRH